MYKNHNNRIHVSLILQKSLHRKYDFTIQFLGQKPRASTLLLLRLELKLFQGFFDEKSTSLL
eukprot:UN12950